MHYFILIYMRCKFVPQEKTDGSTMKTNYKKHITQVNHFPWILIMPKVADFIKQPA